MRSVKVQSKRGFTIVEVLVVIGIIGVLIGLLFPALSAVKERTGETKCASNLRQLGVATINYLAVYEDRLPQVAVPDPFGPGDVIVGTLFGGKAGELPFYEINQHGADDRPLNAFLSDGSLTDEDVPAFECPLDRGQPPSAGDPDNPFDDMPDVDSMYDFVGTSYTLNDHSLDAENCHTLVPTKTAGRPGGKMPFVEDATLSWMLGDLIVYNYQQGGDRGQRWHHHQTVCNLCFVDGHVAQGIELEPATYDAGGFIEQNTTQHYTFLPQRGWLERHCGK